jgi:glycosyltransferase involved in cell wall biosynthesis
MTKKEMSGPDGELPDYLKSLEAILQGAAPAGAPAVAPPVAPPAAPPAPAPSPAIPAGKAFTLSSIGFGTMFTGGSGAAAAASAADEKLRFLLVSTHIHNYTGYSKVTHGILQELAKHPWLELTHFGFQKNPQSKAIEASRSYPAGVDVIDAVALEKPLQAGFGFTALPEIIRRKKPHVVMIYNDLAVVSQFMDAIRASGIPRTFKVWVYCDQVYNTQHQVFLDRLNRDVDRIFAFSPHWKRCLKDQGVTRPIDVLLHGFNSKQAFPIPKELARKTVSLPNDIFLFMNLNRNQPRKRYDILMMAFVELIVKYPTKPVYLLCICDAGQKGGWPLFELYARELKLRGGSVEQFGQRLIIASQDMAYKDEEINMFYNAADVGITTADGEGWGLCQFEQMGVGVPQVVPDIGGFKEFCTAENSVLVKPKHRYYLPTIQCPVGGEAEACDPHDVCLAMEEYLLDSAKRAAHGAAAREKVVGYTWERACEMLVKRLRAVREDDD